MSKKWQCDNCYEIYKTKSELIEHLIDHYERGTQEADNAEYQLDELKKKWRDSL